MSRRAIKAIDWAGIAARVRESEKPEMIAFKAASDKILRRMTANPESPPKLDWAYYRKNIHVPGLVDKFQKEFETMSIPYPTDKYTAAIEAEEKNTQVELEKYKTEIDGTIGELRKDIAAVKALLPFEDMTLEDFALVEVDSKLDLVNNPTPWPHTSLVIEPQKDEDEGH